MTVVFIAYRGYVTMYTMVLPNYFVCGTFLSLFFNPLSHPEFLIAD